MKKKNFIIRNKKWIIIWGICLVAVVGIQLTGNSTASNRIEEEVILRDITTYRSFVGNVEPVSDTTVISKVSEQVVELNVSEGDVVKQGDVIAVIDKTSIEQNIALKEATLTTSQTSNTYTISDAQRNYDNYKEALDKGLNSTLTSAKSNVDSTSNALKKAKEDYSNTETQINNGTYAGTQAEYVAREAAQSAYDAAQTEVTTKQAAFDVAKQAYETAKENKEDTTLLKQAYDEAKEAVRVAKAVASAAKDTLDSAKTSFTTAKKNALTAKQSTIDSAQLSYDSAVKNYNSAKLSADQQLETYKANLDKAKETATTQTSELELSNLKESLDNYTIVAPCDGTITSLMISEGAMVASGTTVATISNLNTMKVAINVDEYSILDTGVGSAVSIQVDSIDKTYEGTLTYVAEVATLSNGVSYFEATVDFIADEYVKSGMSVEVRLTSANQVGVVAVSVNSVQYRDDNTAYVMIKTNNQPEERTVELGVSDGNYVEILSGLTEEDVVLVTPVNGFDMSGMMEMRQNIGGGQ